MVGLAIPLTRRTVETIVTVVLAFWTMVAIVTVLGTQGTTVAARFVFFVWTGVLDVGATWDIWEHQLPDLINTELRRHAARDGRADDHAGAEREENDAACGRGRRPRRGEGLALFYRRVHASRARTHSRRGQARGT